MMGVRFMTPLKKCRVMYTTEDILITTDTLLCIQTLTLGIAR